MAPPIKPVAKMVYICDDVLRDPNSGKVSLLNLWDTVRIPVGSSFPYCLPRVCAFVWWRDGFGKVRTRVRLVQAFTDDMIRELDECIVDFPTRPRAAFARYKFENCVFPESGYYHIEVYCEDEFVDDQIIQVTWALGGDRHGTREPDSTFRVQQHGRVATPGYEGTASTTRTPTASDARCGGGPNATPARQSRCNQQAQHSDWRNGNDICRAAGRGQHRLATCYCLVRRTTAFPAYRRGS